MADFASNFSAAGDIFRSQQTEAELIEAGNFRALYLKHYLGKGPEMTRTLVAKLLLEGAVRSAVSEVVNLRDHSKATRLRRFGTISIGLEHAQRVIIPENDYDRRLNTTPGISLHYNGHFGVASRFPADALRLTTYIRRHNLVEEYPFVFGRTHDDMVRVAKHLGMAVHKPAMLDEDTRYAIMAAHKAARQMRGLPVVKTALNVVSMPTAEFVKSIESRFTRS